MNLYESITKTIKLHESAETFCKIVWGNDASLDNLDDNERWELVGLYNNICNAEDQYTDGKISLKDFTEIIGEECKAHGLSDEETDTAVKFYEKSYKDEEQEDDEDSFIMHNENSDKDVRVWKQDGKWYDEEGNRYMGYLSKQDVKSYFKGNWHEVKESDEAENDGWNTYDVHVGFCGYIGVEQEYSIQARNKNEAVFHALDEQGSEAEMDLNVENIEDNGDGSYEVEVNFAGLESNTYNVTADNEEDASNEALELAKEDLSIISVDGEEFSYNESEDKVEVKTVKDNNGTFFTIYKTKEGKYVDANNRPLDDEDLKQFGLKKDELRHKEDYCYYCGAKLDPDDTYIIDGNRFCGACKGDAEQRHLDDERAYKNRQKDLTYNFNDTYEESDLKENVGDKNDYSDKIKALATKFCKQHYGRLSTYFKAIEVESKTTPNAIKYKLTMDVVTNLSRVYDDVQELGDYISGHIPAVKFIKSDTYNITGSDLDEDLNLYFIQNTEFKDVGGDNVMEDAEYPETRGLGAGSYPEPPENEQYVNFEVTITYKVSDYPFPKGWDNERILDDIQSNISEIVSSADDYEVVEIDL